MKNMAAPFCQINNEHGGRLAVCAHGDSLYLISLSGFRVLMMCIFSLNHQGRVVYEKDLLE